MEVVEFESEQSEFIGEMKFIASFADADGGTEVTILCEDIPKSIRPEDNEMGCKEPLRSWLRSSNNYATRLTDSGVESLQTAGPTA